MVTFPFLLSSILSSSSLSSRLVLFFLFMVRFIIDFVIIIADFWSISVARMDGVARVVDLFVFCWWTGGLVEMPEVRLSV